jgi:16S rRNA (cytidine1402-2'-O)-methyltransferase
VPGTLFVVATPLGNLEDVSLRALDTLRQVHGIACEDTRRTARLLARHGIDTLLLSLHRFNERERIAPLLARLASGERWALVSDGGTPGVSDPGSMLVAAAVEAGIDVRPVPGPSAVAALLSISGLPADRYVFEGFLPARAGQRRRRLRELHGETRTIVLFEAPHRIAASLADLDVVFGARPIVVAREMTKLHEQIVRGTAREVAAALEGHERGELTIAIGGAPAAEPHAAIDERSQRILDVWREALDAASGDRRAALRSAARTLDMRRPELFRALGELLGDPSRR